MHIGHIPLANRLFVAPMAGVTDRPFRQLCKQLGAGYAVSEMVTSRKDLWNSLKTSRRADHAGEPGPIAVQIAGTDAPMMAAAVTLKMRTGWCQQHKNAVALARQFEGVGIQMLTVHGRTREQGYKGCAEYDTIAAVKAAVRVPVVANGDITTPEKARDVLAATGADALMIGRAAQGRPWIFREVGHFLATGEHLAPPLVAEVRRLLLDHLHDHYSLYGEQTGVRSARKHIAWYLRALPGGEALRQQINTTEDCATQWQAVADYLDALGQQMDRLPAAADVGTNTEEQEGMTA